MPGLGKRYVIWRLMALGLGVGGFGLRVQELETSLPPAE